jgi:hypothetical protein
MYGVISTSPRWFSDTPDVVVDGDSGPVGCEDIAPPRVDFGKKGVVVPGPGQTQIESAYTRK